MSTSLREGLPELPPRMRDRPVSDRGYPVPWFAAWVNGKPDLRIIDPVKIPLAVKERLCWICGQRIRGLFSFVIGPMSVINRTNSEPPSHLDCALFAARACPFLTLPRAKRRDANLPTNVFAPPGMHPRNPGVVAVWVTRDYNLLRVDGSLLFLIDEPEEVHWLAEGRAATRGEVMQSIRSGLVILHREAAEDGSAAIVDLAARVRLTKPLLPPPEGQPRPSTRERA